MALHVEGYKEFQRDVRRANKDLGKAIGQAHKEVGKLVIQLLTPPPSPAAVGAGAGAAVRASATAREVLLRVGGAHRKRSPLSQWGKTPVHLFQPAPPRPYILGTAEANEDQIRQELLDQLVKYLAPAFAEAE